MVCVGIHQIYTVIYQQFCKPDPGQDQLGKTDPGQDQFGISLAKLILACISLGYTHVILYVYTCYPICIVVYP